MAEHNIEPLDCELTPVATEMVRRHLLKCAEAGLPITSESLIQTAINERRRIEGTPAEAAYEERWQGYIEAQTTTHLERGDLDLENDAARRQFVQTQTVSFAVIHYLATVIKGGKADG